MKVQNIAAISIPDLWFQAIYNIIDNGVRKTVDKGSFEGDTRLEYDYFFGFIKDPMATPLIPEIPAALDIPSPVTEEYLYGGDDPYILYLMTGEKKPNEQYTYGSRLWKHRLHDVVAEPDGDIIFEENGKLYLNQVARIIDTYKKFGYGNNQMIMQIGQPSDVLLSDPPCLRHIDTRIDGDGYLRFHIYFRSWDLYSGLPANLAAITELAAYMADCIGVKVGSWTVESKGLHLYSYAETLAKIRSYKT